ncbi:MAG: carboxymuconolactone decarboxylase family protein [Armatimonadetes bacterium]|nr:carboxymuconolactone decarboxylase family protein [Armatimonadota bacterium]
MAQRAGRELPGVYRRFRQRYPAAWKAYDALGAAVHGGGPLPEKVRELVKLGIAIGRQHEGAVHAHTRGALRAGAAPDEIRHAALLAITTAGFPAAMAAMTWVEDVLARRRR